MCSGADTIRPKPRLRGVSHLAAAVLALPAVAALLVHARSGVSTASAAVYGAALFGLLLTSGVYHTPNWSQRVRGRLRRADRSMVFVLIAGTYTPFCLMLGGSAARVLLPIVWGAALAGVLKSVAWPSGPRLLTALPYVLLGWVIVPYVADLYTAAGLLVLLLIAAGGVLYTAGALMYACRWPDPAPAVFGYHEVFHLFVVAAVVCHFLAVWLTVG